MHVGCAGVLTLYEATSHLHGHWLRGSSYSASQSTMLNIAHCVVVLQVWPDFLHEAQYPQSILRPGEVYHHKRCLRIYTKPATGALALAPTDVAVAKAASVKPAPAPGSTQRMGHEKNSRHGAVESCLVSQHLGIY